MIEVEELVRFSRKPTGDSIEAADGGHPTSTEVLRQLTAALTAFRRFKALEAGRLDPWEATSLAVAEQGLERAWLAFSQLHADLQKAPRSRA